MRTVRTELLFIAMILIVWIQTEGSSSDVTIISPERLKNVIDFIKTITLHNHLQDIMVRYVAHFSQYDQMQMKTKYGYKTIPISAEINRNLSIMVHYSIHLEYTRVATENRKFQYTDPVNVFQFIRNNTIVIDKIVDHMNGSFNKHKEVEHPAKIHAYNKLRKEKKFFNIKELRNSMKVLLKDQMNANLTVKDFVHGNLHGNTSRLNAEECLDLGELAYHRNISYSVLFYEAALHRFNEDDIYFAIVSNKSQLLDKMIDLYSQYGDICKTRAEQLKNLKSQEVEKDIALMNKEITNPFYGLKDREVNETMDDDETETTEHRTTGKRSEQTDDEINNFKNETDNLEDDLETVEVDFDKEIHEMEADSDEDEERERVNEEHEVCVQFIISESIDNNESSHDEL